jgi:DNA-binding transcriptional LysR family regulator
VELRRVHHVELRKMRYFVAVAETLNFQKAAAQLHMTPPPLITQISDLEAEIGVNLLDRAGRVMQLTDAGRTFLGEARATIQRADQAVTVTKLVARGHAGRLRIGYNALATIGTFPQMVRDFRSSRPNVEISLHYLRSHEQLLALSHDDLEVGFLCSSPQMDEYAVCEVSREPLIALVPESHCLARMGEVSIEALSDVPIVVYSRTLDLDLFRRIRREFEHDNAVMNVIEECDTYLAVMSFAALNNACCLVPASLALLKPIALVSKPLAPLGRICSSLALVTRRTRNVVADAFYQFALRSCPT